MAKDINWNGLDPRKRLAALKQLRGAMNPGAAGTTDEEYHPVSLRIFGRILSKEDGTPISGVLMTYGSYSANTDVNGYFNITEISGRPTGNLIPSKLGYAFSPSSLAITSPMLREELFIPHTWDLGASIAGGTKDYWKKVYDADTSHLVAQYKFSEASGATAVDVSGNGKDLTYVNAVLGQDGIGDGLTSLYLNGTDGIINLSPLMGLNNWQEGTINVWFKVDSAAIWTDGATHTLVYIRADASNMIQIVKSATNNTLNVKYNGASLNDNNITCSDVGWVCVGLTWSKAGNFFRAFLGGVQQGADQNVGTWVGTPTGYIGRNTGGGNFWKGNIAHFAYWNAPLSNAKMQTLSYI